MSWDNITANDYGWTAKRTIKQDGVAVDISSYTTLQFLFEDPSGNVAEKTAGFDTDGTDGTLAYTVPSGDIDEAGAWTGYARIQKAGVVLTSQPWIFHVDADPS